MREIKENVQQVHFCAIRLSLCTLFIWRQFTSIRSYWPRGRRDSLDKFSSDKTTERYSSPPPQPVFNLKGSLPDRTTPSTTVQHVNGHWVNCGAAFVATRKTCDESSAIQAKIKTDAATADCAPPVAQSTVRSLDCVDSTRGTTLLTAFHTPLSSSCKKQLIHVSALRWFTFPIYTM